ncbi:STAS/SEC14 domain-containing protein [Microbulbifer sp. A4B17]|uniref:STAS/SEC14 domain-containing protein n=1 Tax=Microbulbifer sp. A4B17 TaxID=359370 RepID=UPI000D52DE3B|nr:STAS/SEC14 domain-containing protein [Microbulbifer sp. A4B17]AWF83418.1 STAS/SEC14 domain-containing protein [Microbulbifer sp. A4B17]
MIGYVWHQEDRILEVSPVGKLTAEDFQLLAAQIDPIIRKQGRIVGLLVNATDFVGWESLVAMISHFRFIRDHQRHIRRIAVISDSPILRFMPSLACHFISAEVRPFPVGESAQALEWLEKPG